jgi:hypothetical protein
VERLALERLQGIFIEFFGSSDGIFRALSGGTAKV